MVLQKTLIALAALGMLCSPPALAINELVGSGIAPELKISYSLNASEVMLDTSGRSEDLWERIRAGFGLADVNPDLTRRHEQWYTQRADYLQRAIGRSRLYLYHIVGEAERRGMPMEIALLPLIESAFNPMALSPRQASGIWQFITSTGRIYGLRQDAWYDGRRDVLAATQAAMDYLQNLHKQFGSWELALAAYNCGEGCVARAIARNKSRNESTAYADLPLPTETRHYVPKLIAVRNILMAPENAGIVLEALANEPYFMPVNIRQPMAATQAAKLADMSLDEFLALNPAFQRRVIHSDTPGVLLLPADKVETFQINLQKNGAERNTLQTYTARKGELLSSIADRFGVTLQWLKDHNPIRTSRGNKLAAPHTLYVPKAGQQGQTATLRSAKLRTHLVRKGETLSELARRYDVRVSDLRRYNAAADPLKPGIRLNIPPANG